MRVATTLGVLGATLAIVAACGSERPPAAQDTFTPPAKTGGPLFNVDAGATKPPGCGTKDDGSTCECIDAPLFVDPPTIYFVLDSSGSMRVDDRWTQTRLTVANVMRAIGPRANFGAVTFPGPSQDCAPGVEVLPITAGDPPSSGTDGPAVSRLISATAYYPSGGTSTSATLKVVNDRLSGVTGKVFVILATDGAPNCNAAATCSADQCQPNIEHFRNEDVDCKPGGPPNCCAGVAGSGGGNCNDGPATFQAIATLKARGIPVYVIGLPGTEFPVYSQLLNQMAVTGGTPQSNSPTQYYAVKSGTSSEILVALKKIAAQITGTCVFDLKEPPVDPSFVNVYVDDAVLPQEAVNGWSIEGKSVTLLGETCTRVKAGDILSVRIIAGCPTVKPK